MEQATPRDWRRGNELLQEALVSSLREQFLTSQLAVSKGMRDHRVLLG
jgi:hypothetical protein